MQLRFWNLCLNRLFAQDRFHDLRSTGVGGPCNGGLYVVLFLLFYLSTSAYIILFRQAELLWEQFFCNFQERVVIEASSTLGVLKTNRRGPLSVMCISLSSCSDFTKTTSTASFLASLGLWLEASPLKSISLALDSSGWISIWFLFLILLFESWISSKNGARRESSRLSGDSPLFWLEPA